MQSDILLFQRMTQDCGWYALLQSLKIGLQYCVKQLNILADCCPQCLI